MAREFSVMFYRSKQWRKIRAYIFKKYYGICQDCGKPGQEVHHIIFLTPSNINDPSIALGEDNLILLCKGCHSARHNKKEITREDVMFNEFGELIQRNSPPIE